MPVYHIKEGKYCLMKNYFKFFYFSLLLFYSLLPHSLHTFFTSEIAPFLGFVFISNR